MFARESSQCTLSSAVLTAPTKKMLVDTDFVRAPSQVQNRTDLEVYSPCPCLIPKKVSLLITCVDKDRLKKVVAPSEPPAAEYTVGCKSFGPKLRFC